MVRSADCTDRQGSTDGFVLLAVKTPLMPKATTARMPGRLTIRQSVDQLRRESPKDANAAHVLEQLAREMSDAHQFLAITRTGVAKVDPQRTTLDEIAIPREIRTPRGVEEIPMASVEIQAYAKVGQ